MGLVVVSLVQDYTESNTSGILKVRFLNIGKFLSAVVGIVSGIFVPYPCSPK